ncbi:MMPL family transporter [Bacillus sp. JJ1764]|uniref:MMPL family transporter n=1 Tax=Bacillus sp. JJ1764 TaxID=3122964 RepID=UPI003000EA97
MLKNSLSLLIRAIISRRGRWVTVGIWIVLVGILSSTFPNVNKLADNSAANLPKSAMSMRAAKIVAEQFPNNNGTPLLLVWYRAEGLTDQDYQVVSKLYQHLQKTPLTEQSNIPPLSNMPLVALKGLSSEDHTTIITPIFMKKNASTDDLSSDLKTLKAKLVTFQSKSIFDEDLHHKGLHVRFSGPVGIATDATKLFSKADVTLLISTVALVLILLILLYRSPVLAIVPLIGVGFAYGAISPILGFLAKHDIIIIDSQAISIMTVLLFGAGTDYCLFLISKYREVLFEEPDKYKALQRAKHHTGGAIFISAITVVLSLFALYFADFGSYQRFATPFSLAILIMGVVALTLLPALLAIIGRVSFYPFIPRTEKMILELEERKGRKLKRREVHGRFGKVLGRWVTVKPWTVIMVSVLILGILASFAPRIQYTQNLIESFPADMPSREGFEIMAKHFSPGELAPVRIIVKTDEKNIDFKQKLSNLSYVAQVSEPTVGTKNHEYRSFEIFLKYDPYETKSVNLIPEISKQVSATLKEAGINPKDHYWIGGETSTLFDTKKVTTNDYKVIVPIVIAIISLLLLLYLRSIVAMVYLILTVLLSYVSALGAGWLLIHYGLNIPAIQGLIPLYSFVFLVALGEDYNIFMISSIWKYKETHSHKQAISLGVNETSSVITSAGLILAGTFAVLATLPIQVLLQFGIVTAIGVILDTFVVRPLLVPAITTVLGRYAFWPGKLWRVDEGYTKMNDQEE